VGRVREAFAADGLGRKQWDVPGGIDRSVSKNALESVSSRSMLSAWPYYCVMSICRFSICFITRAHIYSSVLWDEVNVHTERVFHCLA
jgi:hypothetical protein